MIRKEDILDLFEMMEEENWDYSWGGAREGLVDCSGAFVYAYDKLGGPDIQHSSNAIARLNVLGGLRSAREARPGWAVFKWKEEDTPKRWQADGKGNYYHIGLMGREGRVLNAKGTASGFVASPLSEGWDYAAPLADVLYDEEVPDVLYQAKVMTKDEPLNLRNAPDISATVVGHIPRGAIVDVLTEGEWPCVKYKSLLGYVSGQYIQRVSGEISPVVPDVVPPATGETTTFVRDDGVKITLLGRWYTDSRD